MLNCLFFTYSLAQTATLVKDIALGNESSEPIFGTVLNNSQLLFGAFDGGRYGYELWTSDGMTTGTVILKDLKPGGGSSAPQQFFTHQGIAYFFTDLYSGITPGFWRSDGTANGTYKIGNAETSTGFTFSVPIGENLYFLSPTHGFFKKNLTDFGFTVLFDKSVDPAITQFPILPEQIAYLSNKWLFTARTGGNVVSIYASNGTIAGTGKMVSFISNYGNFPITALESKILAFFIGQDGLSVTDGTASNTRLVKNIYPDTGLDIPSGKNLFPLQNQVLFIGRTNDSDYGIWGSDGTEAGTQLIKPFYFTSGQYGGGISLLTGFSRNSGILYFLVSYDGTNRQLWRTDGTTAGTFKLGEPTGNAENLRLLGTYVYYVDSENNLIRLGPTANTSQTIGKMENAFRSSSSPKVSYIMAENAAFYVGSEPQTGLELWKLTLPPNTCTTMYTLKNGNWNDPTVWSCNRIPTANDFTELRHSITVLANSTALSRFVRYSLGGRLLIGNNAKVKFY